MFEAMDTNMTNSTLDLKDTQSLMTSIIVMFSQIISLSVGLPLNCYVIFLLFTQGALKDMDVTFTISQSTAEILLSFTAPLSITCHVNPELCAAKLLGFFWGISISARCYFQCFVCLERYLAVLHPITFLRYNHVRYRLACVAVSCTNSLVYAVPCAFTFPQLPYRALAYTYSVIFFMDVFCFLSILKALRRPGPGGTKKRSNVAGRNAMKCRAIKIVLVNLMVFLMQNFPLLCLFIMNEHLPLKVFNLAIAASMPLNFTAGFVNPIFFLYKAGKLQLMRCL